MKSIKRIASQYLVGAAAAAGLLLIGSAQAGAAQAADPRCPPGVPPGVACGGKDMSAVTAGTYALDPAHTSVVARVSHLGYSHSIFRFGEAEGTLQWNPADPSRSSLRVTVKTNSIATPVKGFADELAGEKFLNSKRYPEATFASTRFRRTSLTHGRVDGRFTLMGRTRPVTFEVDLIGAGKGFGKPRMGIQARGTIMPGDYGLPPVFNTPIELVIDAEFEKAA